MRQPRIDDLVRLTHDIPELSLARGEVGVVRSTWFAPETSYEVEFQRIGSDVQTRALVQADGVGVNDPSAPEHEPFLPEPDAEFEFIQD